MALNQSDFVATFSQMFQDMFLIRYQAVGRLRGTVREMHGLVGDAYKLKYMDQIEMSQHGAFNADIPRTNVTTTAPTISFTDWDLKTSIDEFEQLNFNASALQGFAEVHADAIGRREDQFIIDALAAGVTAGKSIADGGTNMTMEKLRTAYKLLADDEVDGQDMYLIMGSAQHDSLLGETEYSSALFNAAKPLVNPGLNGYVGKFMGFNLIVLGNRPEGGLPVAGNIRDCFVYARTSTTMGYRKDPETRMIPEEWQARTVALSLLSAGATVGDDRGVVKISCDETA